MPNLLMSDKSGKILIHPDLKAAGMEAGNFFPLGKRDLIELPPTSQIFTLPFRLPVGIDPRSENTVAVDGFYAVAAFIAPGYTVTKNSAYRESPGQRQLPLYSYAACALQNDRIHVAAVRVDRDKRHDSRYIDMGLVKKNIKKFKKIFPGNRLVRHLEKCALVYGCPNARNFFLARFEAALPTSSSCNASCAGCISFQRTDEIPPSQPRIRFTPSPDEIAQIALYHIANARNAIVSFGQGCEGEPLIAGGVIEKGIRLIRQRTSKGTININTNASRPDMISRLLDAGLDSMRVSLNSIRPSYYNRYYNPRDYSFKDVMKSMKLAGRGECFISLNYLTMPGFTDTKEETGALKIFLREYNAGMIQWRNLNYDPMRYFRILKLKVKTSEIIGIKETIESLEKEFPDLRMGYFNPSPRVIAFRRRQHRGL